MTVLAFFLFQLQQRRLDRSVINRQFVVADLLVASGNAVAVQRP